MADPQQTIETPVPGFLLIHPIISFSTQLLCVWAVAPASMQLLKRWIAISSLKAPTEPEPAAGAPISVAEQRKGLKRFFNKDTIPCLLSASFFLSIQLFIYVILPRIKSQGFINAFWSLFAVLFMALSIDGTARIALSPPTAAKLVALNPFGGSKRFYEVKYDERPRPRFWTVAVFGALGAVMFAYYMGNTMFTPIMTAAWVFAFSVNMVQKGKLHMRYMLMILNGYIAAIPILTLIIAGIVQLFSMFGSNTTDEPEPKKDNDQVRPSDWVIQMIMCFVLALPTWVPGMMIACALRFDHSQSQTSLVVLSAPGESVEIPKSVPGFAKPTFYAGLTALAATLGGLKLLNLFLRVMPEGLDMFYLVATIPVVSIAMLLSAWSRGQLREFWQYTETWTPTHDEAVAAKNDIEASPVAAKPAEDETQRLLVDDEKEDKQ